MVHKSYGIIAYRKNSKGEPEFLLVKNKSGDHWGFPKGTPDLHETPVETARREFKEETGLLAPLELSKETFMEKYEFKGRNGETIAKINTYFVGRIVDGQVAETIFKDIEEAAWKTYTEALSTLTFEHSQEILSNVYKLL